MTPSSRAGTFRLHDWVIDPSRDLLMRGSDQVKIEPKAMEVLVLLAERAGEVVSQAELESRVWKGVVVTPQSVYQCIAQLRRVLGDNVRAPLYIETVPRRGYRLLATVIRDDQAPAENPVVPPEAEPGTAPARRRRVEPRLAGAVLAACLILALVGWRIWVERNVEEPESIAVLNFDDLSPDRSNGYLGELLVDELTTALGEVAGLRVAARRSARLAARADAGLAEIGEQLGVRRLLHGNVRRVGDRVQVSAALVDAETGYELWSRRFERPAASVARLPADIAAMVAGAVGLSLAGPVGVRGSHVAARNPTAYDYYMLGQQRLSERTAFSLAEAQRYFQLALEADSGFAAAYAAMAEVHIGEFYFANRQLGETVDLVRPLVDAALGIDPEFGLARAIRGWVALESGDYTAAEVDLRNAVQQSPNLAVAHLWLGNALFAASRPREALETMDRAAVLDPLSFIVHVRRALVLDALGQHDAAVEAATRAVILAPTHPNPRWTLGLIALSQGRLAQAIAHYDAALALDASRSDLRVQLATLLLDAGRAADARAQLAEAAERAQSSHAYLTALAYQALLDGKAEDLADIAESLASIDPRNSFLTMDAANTMVLAGRHAQAVELFDRVPAEHRDAMLNDLWMLRWGLDTAPSCLAAAYAALGRDREFGELASRTERFLAGASERGVRYWGIHYQRAGIAALRGKPELALASLESAAAAGWRRTWWARNDPAMAPLRTRPEFELLLSRIEAGTRDH